MNSKSFDPLPENELQFELSPMAKRNGDSSVSMTNEDLQVVKFESSQEKFLPVGDGQQHLTLSVSDIEVEMAKEIDF